VGWRAYPPPCGQLTRCFSAVAELLVISCTPQSFPDSIMNLENNKNTSGCRILQ